MGLLQLVVVGIVAIEAERRAGLGQVEPVFRGGFGPGLVGGVAGVAAHVERRMPAALLGGRQSGLVALAAEVFPLASRYRLEQLILVVAGVGIVAIEAVANRGRMDGPLDVGGFLVRVTGNAKGGGGGADQLDAGDIFVDPDL